jgi:integrase
MSLTDARSARSDARELVKIGKNPAHVRKEEIANNLKNRTARSETFKVIALEWMNKQIDRWSVSHANAVMKSLRSNVFPEIGSIPIQDVVTPDLVKMLEKIEKRGALEMARKVLQRVNSIFMYANRQGKISDNPAANLKGSLKTRKVVHRPALSKDGLPQFFKDLEKARMHISTKLGLRFLILTASRTDEVRRSVWSEIDFSDKMWRIPAERMKMDSPHNVPLSRQALELLDHIGDIFGKSGYIFPSVRDYKKPMSQNALLYAMHGLGYHSKATVHGFRATFSTIANEEGFKGDVIEKALAHVERNRVRAAYHRSEYIEQRRELMQWWADYLLELENFR